MPWNKLSMADRAKYISLGVQNGITNLDDIRSIYNSYAEGGTIRNYTTWKGAIKNHKDIDIDKDDTYDYKDQYNSDGMNIVFTKRYNKFGEGGLEQDTSSSTDNIFEKLGEAINAWSQHRYTDLPEFTVTAKRPKKLGFFDRLIRPYTWFAPKYNKEEYPTLKEALFKAYNDGNDGKTIIWDDRAYKAELNDDDTQERFNLYDNNTLYNNHLEGEESYINNARNAIINTGFNPELIVPKYNAEQMKEIRKLIASNKEIIGEGDMYSVMSDPLPYIYNAAREYQLRALQELSKYEYSNIYNELKDASNTLTMNDIANTELSKIKIPKHIIEAVVNNLDNEEDIWDALAIPMKEFRYGQGTGNDRLSDNEGFIRMVYNNHGYENDNFAMNMLGALYRQAKNGKVSNKEVNKALGNFMNIMKEEPEVWEYMTSKARKVLPYDNAYGYKAMEKALSTVPNFFQDAVNRLHKGTYNPKEAGYSTSVAKFKEQMKKSKVLRSTVEEYMNKKNNTKNKHKYSGGGQLENNTGITEEENQAVVNTALARGEAARRSSRIGGAPRNYPTRNNTSINTSTNSSEKAKEPSSHRKGGLGSLGESISRAGKAKRDTKKEEPPEEIAKRVSEAEREYREYQEDLRQHPEKSVANQHINTTSSNNTLYSSVMSNIDRVTSTLQKGIRQAIHKQDTKNKERLKVSLNGANAATTIASFFTPQLNVLNSVLSGISVMDDVNNENYGQAALGIAGLAAPIFRAFNPTLRYTTRNIDSSGRVTHTTRYIPTGEAGYYTGTVGGLAGDIYGLGVDDKWKIIQ